MDTDDLDDWLDEQDTAGRRPSTAWPDRHERGAQTDRPAGRRPRWLIAGIAGGGLWVLVMAVVVLPGRADDPPPGPADADPMAAAEGVSGGGELPGELDAADLSSIAPSTLSGPSEAAAVDAVGSADDPADIGPDHAETDHADVGVADLAAGGVQAAAAVAALRTQLTRSDQEGDSYLELAVPLWVERIGEGIDVVVVQVSWLEGAAGRLTSVNQGRWAVPVTTDGTVLTAAWPVPGGTPAELPPEAPPTGTLRLDEVSAALTDAGWDEVEVLAAELHPLLDDVLVALTRGRSPHGADVGEHLVWVQELPEGLQLLGVGR